MASVLFHPLTFPFPYPRVILWIYAMDTLDTVDLGVISLHYTTRVNTPVKNATMVRSKAFQVPRGFKFISSYHRQVQRSSAQFLMRLG
jgi:hypothetical protein